MFEDSTFESNGRIRTRSRGWMIFALILDAAILLALILIPLVHPEALPNQAMAFLMQVPPPPVTPPPTAPRQAVRSTTSATEIIPVEIRAEFQAPRRIPQTIVNSTGPAPGDIRDVASIDPSGAGPGGDGDVFRSQPAPRVVHPDIKVPMRVPSSVGAGLLIRKVIPPYPELAKVMRVEGTVELAATISKIGTIANLRVVSGPPALQQAAFDAVSNWRYRPYLLNGQPVDVETTVNVVFSLQR